MTDTIDYYGYDADYIHLKFGHAWKMSNFTEDFRAKHPKFVEEYHKYCDDDGTSKFKDGLQLVNYVKHFGIPVHFYKNYTDEPVTVDEAQQYFVEEAMPDDAYQFVDGKMLGWDGEEAK